MVRYGTLKVRYMKKSMRLSYIHRCELNDRIQGQYRRLCRRIQALTHCLSIMAKCLHFQGFKIQC
jgi:hypothetical protein